MAAQKEKKRKSGAACPFEEMIAMFLHVERILLWEHTLHTLQMSHSSVFLSGYSSNWFRSSER